MSIDSDAVIAEYFGGDRLYIRDSANQILYLCSLDGALVARFAHCVDANSPYRKEKYLSITLRDEATSLDTSVLIDGNGVTVASASRLACTPDGYQASVKSDEFYQFLDMDGNVILEEMLSSRLKVQSHD